VTYVALTLCFKLRSFFALITFKNTQAALGLLKRCGSKGSHTVLAFSETVLSSFTQVDKNPNNQHIKTRELSSAEGAQRNWTEIGTFYHHFKSLATSKRVVIIPAETPVNSINDIRGTLLNAVWLTQVCIYKKAKSLYGR